MFLIASHSNIHSDPTSSAASATCFFCNGRQWSSSLSVGYFQVVAAHETECESCGSFFCCERHGETECPNWEGKHYKAYKSMYHDASFFHLNRGVEINIGVTKYSGFMEQCKTMVDMVRRGERTGFY
ncbi:hypothetical protein Aduo_005767 [Ancylostoma duodenale]